MLIERDGRWTLGREPMTSPANGLLGADVAFPVLHGPYGEDGTVQGALECLDVAYVGPGVLAAAVCIDKLASSACSPSTRSRRSTSCRGEDGWRERALALGLPVWVKPSRLGSSVGIVESIDQLDAAVEAARRHDPRVIVEANSSGREVECSVIGNDDPETSLPGEIVAHADWYDYEAKYGAGGMDLVVPAPLDDDAVASVRELAASVYRASRGAAGSRAATSSSTSPARCWSTSSTRSPGSPRRACSESSSRRPASPIPSSATGSSTTRSSATRRSARTASKEGLDPL